MTDIVQHHMERFRQMLIRFDELTQPGWGNADRNHCRREMTYGRAEQKVQAVV